MILNGFVASIRYDTAYIDIKLDDDTTLEMDLPTKFCPELREGRRCTMELKDVPDIHISDEEYQKINEEIEKALGVVDNLPESDY